MSKLRRAITLSVMVMTVLSMSMVTAVSNADAATAEAGDLIKMEGLSSVYYLGEDGKRYVFPTEDNYFSWYSDFSGVVTIPQSELESYPLGSNITIRPGTHLVKITTDPKVYAVEEGGVLRPIPDEDTAETLYGENWADRVVDVPDAFFVNYTIEDEELSADTYPQGTLVQPADSNDIYYINAEGEAQLIEDEAAFEANRFGWNFIVQADEDYELPTVGDEITGAVNSLIDPSQGTSGDTSEDDDDDEDAGSGLSVSLASDTPASASIPAGNDNGNADPAATLVPFTDVNFTASNDGDVTVEDLTVKRIGVGNRDGLGKVYIYQDGEKISRGRSLNTDGEVTFGLDHKISAGETDTLTIRANISGDKQSGNHGFAITEASAVETNGATVSGSFPVQGNIMSLANVESATVDIEISDGNDLSDLKVGEENQALAEVTVEEVSGEEDVLVHSITLENRGSVDIEDLSNFVLEVNGDTVAELESSDSDYVQMVLDEPYEVDDSEDFVLKADIDRGAGDSVKFRLDEVTDINVTGETYGYGAGVNEVKGDDDSLTEWDTSDNQTIATSDFSVTEASSNPSSQDVAIGEDDVTFLVAELDTAEDGVIVEELKVKIATNTADANIENSLENLSLYLDGSRVAGPLDVDLDTEDKVTVDSEFEVQGLQNLTVKADITDDADAGDYKMTIDTADMSVEDMDGNIIDGDEINGSAEGNYVSVGLGDADLSKDETFGDREVVAGTNDLKVAQFILEAPENEDLDINSYNVKVTNNGTDLEDDAIDNLYVNEESAQSVSFDSESERSFSVNETLGKGETKVVSVYLDLDKDATSSQEIQAEMNVEAEGSISGEDATGTGFDDNDDDNDFVPGQTMTVAQGTLTMSVGAGTPKKQILVAGSEDVEVAEFEFSSENDGFDITEMDFAIVNDSDVVQTGLVTELKVNDNNYKAVTNGTVSITDEVRVDADEDVTVEVRVKLNDDFNAINSGDELYVALTDYEYEDDATGDSTWAVADEGESSATTTNVLAVYNTNLTVSTSKGSANSLGNTWNEMMDIEFTADANDKATVNQIALNIDPQGATVTDIRLLDGSGDEIDSTSSVAFEGGATVESATDLTLTLDNPDADGVIAAGTSETYTVEVDVTNAQDEDSVVIELIEGSGDGNTFEWDDDEYYDENNNDYIWENLDLIDDLSGSYELIR